MSKLFRQQTNRESVGILTVDVPTLIKHNPGIPSEYMISNEKHSATCVGCLNPPCIRFADEELSLSEARLCDFPSDADDTVCPLNAIVWERGANTPTIINERCINCGICARRCPFGAIYSDGTTGIIHKQESEVVFLDTNERNIEIHKTQVLAILDCRHIGNFCYPETAPIEKMYEKLLRMPTEAQFPNLITRNLFLVLGNECIISRRGDVIFRLDALVANTPSIGVVEIEFSKDSLESPRAILDDIAVLHSRYGIGKDEVTPFIVSLELPNIRTEYWRVLKDIKGVLGISIQSITLGALCVLAWSFFEINIGTVNFYIDIDTPSFQAEVERLLGEEELPKITSYAVYEPIK
jgi:Fe-S-cluster-containing dehydrogenase component